MMDTQAKIIHRVSPPGRPPHVCVIGAGLAGLRCAEVLLDGGFQVTILEGRDRIGGRVHQSSDLGYLVDLGPNWIHGTEGNPVLELAKETNAVFHKWEERLTVYDRSGKQMSQEEASRFDHYLWGIIADAFKYSNDHSAEIDAEKSLWDFFVEKSGSIFPEEEGRHQDRLMLLSMAESWGAFVGSPIKRQSLKYFWLEECIEGGRFRRIPYLVLALTMSQRTFFLPALTRTF
jgi:phytoene dehydrogenase-like protein